MQIDRGTPRLLVAKHNICVSNSFALAHLKHSRSLHAAVVCCGTGATYEVYGGFPLWLDGSYGLVCPTVEAGLQIRTTRVFVRD